VSKEEFTIVQCGSCGFRFTNPRPDEATVGKYYQSEDYISHSNTSKGLINSAYQSVRKITLKRKLKQVCSATGKQQGKLLDMGCGTGEFLNTCKQAGWTVQGIEPSPGAREFAIKQYGLDVKDAGAWNAFTDNAFDAVTAWHVLEHVYDLAGTLQQVKRILLPGGAFIVALPNCSSADAEFYGRYWAAYDVPRHIWHFTPAHVKTFFEKQGYKLESVLPMPFDAYYISMLSEKYKGGNVNYGRALVHGYFSNSSAAKKGNTYSSQVYILRPLK
jgi:SAM-dependent methyltransferase